MADERFNPLIVQSDRTVLLEVDNPRFEAARDCLARFAELEKSPEHVHTYRITPLSIWNAAAAGLTADEILQSLTSFSKYPLPAALVTEIKEYASRYGRLVLRPADPAATGSENPGRIYLESSDPYLIEEIWRNDRIRRHLTGRTAQGYLELLPLERGRIKQGLIKLGFPVVDRVGYVPGAPLPIRLRDCTRAGKPFALRPYQQDAVRAFLAPASTAIPNVAATNEANADANSDSPIHGSCEQTASYDGGSGVVVLPCGAGKTMVGLAVMAHLSCETLILATSTAAVHQWIREIFDKTDLSPDEVGEYTGEEKHIKPVTVATYQILTHRKRKGGDFPHFALFNQKDWGLVIYDEVHLLPAEVFRITAEIQSRRRLGLTATLVREDKREDDVFTLIGPKRYDVPWKTLEQQGWIATAQCTEVRVELPESLRWDYAVAESREQFRLAATNPAKLPVVEALVRKVHAGESILVIGHFLDQLETIAGRLGSPLITGQTGSRRREQLYDAFRRGDEPVLVVSRVANFSLDLPEASVAIQVSGTFGSRQEEAQRLGRILRPKASGRPASFYTLVTRETQEQSFALRRQLFLTEQGYRYHIADGDEIQ